MEPTQKPSLFLVAIVRYLHHSLFQFFIHTLTFPFSAKDFPDIHRIEIG